MQLKIEYLNKEELKPYVNNAKLHPAEQIEQIKNSIREFGFNDPIAIWHDNEIIEGHGRLLAVMEMPEIEKVPVIRLDELTDEQRRAYTLVHNKLTMNTDFDSNLLELELSDINNINMDLYGFELINVDDIFEEKYTGKTDIPQYEPSKNNWAIKELYDDEKTKKLISGIVDSEIDEDAKDFLIKAAYRHTRFNYKRIADFYAKAPEDIQKLMEQSALVIIDCDDAIKNGYTTLDRLAGEYAYDEA